jgi:hypothetical protein
MHIPTPHRRPRFSIVIGMLLLIRAATPGFAAPAPPAIGADDGWALVSKSEKLTIYSRPRKDSGILEVKAVGVIEAAPAVAKRVLDDTAEYPRFMPYVTESRVISRKGDTLIGYQRLSVPLVNDRDCTMRIRCQTWRDADGGTCFCNRWEAANDLGPAEKSGVARIRINEGSWLLEPLDGGRHTRATYTVCSDSGGKLPAPLVNLANRTAIPKLFDSIRQQVKKEKYLAAK